MLHDEAGRLHNIPAGVKEALHEIPAGYTDLGDGDERSRHRLVANGWHWGVAHAHGTHGGAAGGGFGAGRPQDHHGVVDGGPVRRRTPGHEPPTPPGVPAGPPRG